MQTHDGMAAASTDAPIQPEPSLVMVVDDSATVRAILESHLVGAGYRVCSARDGEDALRLARQLGPDLLLVDVTMPVMDGFELTRRLRDDPRTSGASIILITARDLSADKQEGLSAGADDYIVKPFDTFELLARVHGVLRRAADLRAQSPLTGLPGNGRIHQEIERRIAAGRGFAILHADIDHFKAYNDHYGFSRGDTVIKLAARVVAGAAVEAGGPGTFVGHVGGDDFVVVCEPDAAGPIAEEILRRFDEEVGSLYDPADAARGFIEGISRTGVRERFPMASISVGATSSEGRDFSHPAEAVASATATKEVAKRQPGSAWAMDRRRTRRRSARTGT
jgi:diguanylate cyclase (GGDEF)-like protein